MRKIIHHTYIIALLALLVNPLSAQKESLIFNAQIPVRLQSLRQVEDSVQLVMDIDLTNVQIEADRFLLLTPMLVTPQGKELSLKNILINGSRRHKAFMRGIKLNGWESQINEVHHNVINLNETGRRVYRYRQSVGFENWMRNAGMEISAELCACGGYTRQLTFDKIADRIISENAKTYRVSPTVTFICPEVEEVKARSESVDVFLDFPVASTEINPVYGNNPRELQRLEQLLRELHEDKNLTVTGVMITGYASPEGDVNFNNRLSVGRVEALRNYLSMRAGIPFYSYQIEYGGEDWKGLTNLVRNSYIEPKETILSIISFYNPIERKERLKALNGGRTYQYLLHALYPQLRRVVSRIDYTARKFDIDEAKRIIKTRPKQLSLNEIFQVANTYREGSKEFREVIETAIKCFPNDPVANLNAAASALLEKDIIRAEHYLQKSRKNTPEYYNNLGVLEMIKGNNKRAKSLFERAAKTNSSAALKNMEELIKKDKADKQMIN
ncbi:outer membrane protein OmpA-like peptidoglycan-associated protein [Parabacteroides sp. PF5-5]|uniref:DUF3868 domain-containing protein n=1 Tax=unclassified Parabacteroides TaxID=2649774 RepID=UPI002474A392|nr:MULTISPECIES: DUF3868 domain-containing protein [unclassified Parabacteroides]MDH6303635.1 outer membrane protein OmpA-like peptidoglycan-associated protein [Parabacteroides sp. PH5-39]MDH6314957.1 outer membrane protein OmpA-like peptidoglycan-associated protein [Parabacteroides sp. PF5-13]MDH6318294.1 outer membrane protein OmpA-like peptidoglycan-associated protein [Parabacteroides sp. PH5-13]MDH6321773.1 outer membrane protein OmpA-like peptidoglycan-associated protein [Parabacteroides s